jgi:Ribonuclease G/E
MVDKAGWSDGDRKARKRLEERVAKAKNREAERKRSLHNLTAKQYRTRQQYGKYNASAIICRHCRGDGHNPIAVTSCYRYCKHCEVVGHVYETCAARAEDEVNNAHTNDDAKRYQVFAKAITLSVICLCNLSFQYTGRD